MQIIVKNINEIEPYANNPRLNEDAVPALMESIKQFGWKVPIVIDRNNVIVAGHTRYKAAQRLKIKDIPCIVADDLTDDQIKAYRLADNKIGEIAQWDFDALGIELDDIEMDMTPFGFDDDPGEPIEVEEDDFDEEYDVNEHGVERGQVWILGNHRLMCGDSTSSEDMSKLMDGTVADITFTSPPYNAHHMDLVIDNEEVERTQQKYLNDDDQQSQEEYTGFLYKNMDLLLDHSNEVLYNIGVISGSKRSIVSLLNHYIDEFKDLVYWKKSNPTPTIAKGVVSSAIELIMAFSKKNNTRSFDNCNFGGKGRDVFYGVIEGNVASGNEYASIHKATFPIYLPSEIVSRFTETGGAVLDCFGGTGTTMIACEQLKRRCYMMELEPMYCDVILSRWEKLTGKEAVKIEP